MSKRKSNAPRWREYPKPDHQREGCKVGWRIYRSAEDAAACAAAAKHNAQIQLSGGYDFGYQSPGSITVLADGRYEVCVP